MNVEQKLKKKNF
jgi:hypothetical protein